MPPPTPNPRRRRRLWVILAVALLPSLYLLHVVSLHASNARHERVWDRYLTHAHANAVPTRPVADPIDLIRFDDESQPFRTTHGLAAHLQGYKNSAGEIVIPAVYRTAQKEFTEGLAFIGHADGTRGYIRPDGSLAFAADFPYAEPFVHAMAHVRTERDSGPYAGRLRSGYIDATGRVVVEPQYSSGSHFVGPYARVARSTIYAPIYERLMDGIDIDVGLGWPFPEQRIFIDNQGRRVSPRTVERSMRPQSLIPNP